MIQPEAAQYIPFDIADVNIDLPDPERRVDADRRWMSCWSR